MSEYEARRGYRKAQSEMKSMTREIRDLRVQLGVSLIWDSNWRVEAIKIKRDSILITAKHFKKFYDAELFEMEVFGG